jgi:hypothetical protein
MADAGTSPWAELLVYGFGRDADFEGRLIGAIEGIESGGTLRVLDALFVHRDADTGELSAIDVHGDGAGSIVEPLLEFELDAGARRRATAHALANDRSGIPSQTLLELGRALAPGASVAALLVDHAWRRALEDGVARSGGVLMTGRRVEVETLGRLRPDLLSAARAAGGPPVTGT